MKKFRHILGDITAETRLNGYPTVDAFRKAWTSISDPVGEAWEYLANDRMGIGNPEIFDDPRPLLRALLAEIEKHEGPRKS